MYFTIAKEDAFMDNYVPKIAAIHDLSGFGRCSLMVIIPVLSTMGIQVCPVPTAILSTHSGGFGKFSFTDLTDNMDDYISHWKSIGIKFDCIYSGFLGSERQIDIISNFFKDFKLKSNPLIVVDPVMADHGKLYATYTIEMKQKMELLVRKADIITPNLTETYFLLNEPYHEGAVDEKEMKRILKKLSQMGPSMIVITGIMEKCNHRCNIGYDKCKDKYWKVRYKQIPADYPGTGDVFASVLTGGFLTGDSLPVAMDRATQFLYAAIKETYRCKTPNREGILLEKVLGLLNNRNIKYSYEAIS
jgi:pyridoxine kinase